MRRQRLITDIFMFLICTFCLCRFACAENEVLSVRNGSREVSRVAITIDDCYDRKHIQEAIELCETYDVVITFFPIGKALKFADASLWQRALNAGCEIGNHSWGHTDLTRLSARDIRFQMLRTQQKVDEMLGYHYPMQVLRPPLGFTSSKVAKAIASVGYLGIVRWDVSQTDPHKALKATQNGSILLFHARAKDITCLKTLIPMLKNQGYECVTVSELLNLPPITTATYIYDYEPTHADDPNTIP